MADNGSGLTPDFFAGVEGGGGSGLVDGVEGGIVTPAS